MVWMCRPLPSEALQNGCAMLCLSWIARGLESSDPSMPFGLEAEYRGEKLFLSTPPACAGGSWPVQAHPVSGRTFQLGCHPGEPEVNASHLLALQSLVKQRQMLSFLSCSKQIP